MKVRVDRSTRMGPESGGPNQAQRWAVGPLSFPPLAPLGSVLPGFSCLALLCLMSECC